MIAQLRGPRLYILKMGLSYSTRQQLPTGRMQRNKRINTILKEQLFVSGFVIIKRLLNVGHLKIKTHCTYCKSATM